jgi:hypothetical protein
MARKEIQLGGWLGMYAALALVVGACAAIFWRQVVPLPIYHIESDFSASISEALLALTVQSDLWFSACGLVLGVGLGVVAWSWFSDMGVLAVFLAPVGALLAAGTAWFLGSTLLGPSNFEQRLVDAVAGDVVSASLEVHSPSAVVVWALAAVLGSLVCALVSLMWDKRRRPGEAGGDEQGGEHVADPDALDVEQAQAQPEQYDAAGGGQGIDLAGAQKIAQEEA